MTACPLAVQLYTFRDELVRDPAAVVARIADMGFAGVEVLCAAGMPDGVRERVAASTVDAATLKPLLDGHGLAVCAAHTALPESWNAAEVFEEQRVLGSEVLVVPGLAALPGATNDDLSIPDALRRVAERFNEAAALAAAHGMRIGYHNHHWEWNGTVDGRPGYEAFWERVDPSIVAEVDLYWAQAAGQDPARVVAALGTRAELVHLKDGPVAVGEPMTAVGQGRADVKRPLEAGAYVRWHVVELDDCASDVFEATRQSVDWLVAEGLSCRR